MTQTTEAKTWEDWLGRIRRAVLEWAWKGKRVSAEEAKWILSARIVYSAGTDVGVFGATHHESWLLPDGKTKVPVLSVEALVQCDAAQLCSTLIHEAGHILATLRAAGERQGHNDKWKEACTALGYSKAVAYAKPEDWQSFDPSLSDLLRAIALPSADGRTAKAWQWSVNPDDPPGTVVITGANGFVYTRRFRCSDGAGSQGGVSAGAGSGSRYLLAMCTHADCGFQARITGKWAQHRLTCAGSASAPHDPLPLTIDAASLPATRRSSDQPGTGSVSSGNSGSVIRPRGKGTTRAARSGYLDGPGDTGKPSDIQAPLTVSLPLWPSDQPLPRHLALVPFVKPCTDLAPFGVTGRTKRRPAETREREGQTAYQYKLGRRWLPVYAVKRQEGWVCVVRPKTGTVYLNAPAGTKAVAVAACSGWVKREPGKWRKVSAKRKPSKAERRAA